MLKNVSEAGATAEGSANTLIATMKAFKLEANDSQHVVDALNEVSNKYAISVNDLSTAIRKSSASMAAGNNSLEQTFGLVTAGTEILREPGRVANGLSTITARLTKKNDEYIASITGGMGVIDKNTGELRSTYDILQDLSKAWGHLTSVEKQELTETVAGKTQRALFTALMQNFSSAVGASEAALKSEGSAVTENTKRMNSLQGKTQQLQSAWQDFARNTIDSGMVKSILTLGTEILKFANTDMGRFILVIGTATTAIGLLKKALTAEHLLKFASGFNVLTQAVAAGTAAFNVQSAAGGVFSASMYAGAASVEVFTKALLASPLFGAAVGGLAIYGIIKAMNTLVPQMKDLEDATEKSTQAYEDAQAKTKQVKSELEGVNSQIDQLQKKGKLSITDEKDLENLKNEKKELQAELEIYQKLEKAKKDAAAVDIKKELEYISNNPIDFFNVNETEKSIEDAKKILKDAGNSIASSLGNDRENIRRETQDMITAYKELAEEISKQKEKMAKESVVSEDDQKKLEEMENVYAQIGGHLSENAEKFKDWSDTLEGGGEQAEETKGAVDNLRQSIYDAIGTTDDSTEAIENATNAQTEYQKQLEDAQGTLDTTSESLDNLQNVYKTLTTAVDEYNSNGYLSIDTLQSLLSMSDQYLSALSMENGQLVLNTTALDQMTDSMIAAKVQEMQAAAVADIYALAQGNVNQMSTLAQTAVNNLGNDASAMGKQFASAVPDINKFTEAILKAKAAAGSDTTVENFDQKANAIISSYQNLYKNVTSLGSGTTRSGGLSKSGGHRYTGKSTGGKKSGGSKSGGSKSRGSKSTKSTKEEYKATIDTLYKYKNALDNAKESVDKLQDALKNTDNLNEQEKYMRQLIDALNDEINKTNELKAAQTRQINDYINQLRAQGFAIDYNSSKNELYINNMQHLADFSGDTAKHLEKLINKTQDLNSDNRKLDGSVRDLKADIKDYYDQIADIPEKKLKKFNELMKDFQQNRLDQIQNQIDDIQHEMDNDPRLKQLENQIEALENQNDELDKQKELEEKLLAVEEAKEKLANANRQKTLQVYREGQGFVWETDPDTIKDAADELKQAQDDLNDKIKQDQIEQLNAEKEALEKSYQDRIDALQNFLDEQNYQIDKANREGIKSFQDLQKEMAKYGLDSAEYLGKATNWLNNYNKSLADLNNTVNGILSSSSQATDGLIYSSAVQDRINQALSSIIPVTTQTGLKLNQIDYDKIKGNTDNQSIYINNIELPNVKDIDDFVKALKDLPRMATSQSTMRT